MMFHRCVCFFGFVPWAMFFLHISPFSRLLPISNFQKPRKKTIEMDRSETGIYSYTLTRIALNVSGVEIGKEHAAVPTKNERNKNKTSLHAVATEKMEMSLERHKTSAAEQKMFVH